MLIDDQNLYHGLVSGGCLEGDLLEHAKVVFQNGGARIVTYDLRGDQDALWGVGIGCNGMTRLLLQLVSADTDYEPLRSIVHTWQTQLSRTIVCVTESCHPQIPVGMSLFQPLDGSEQIESPGSSPINRLMQAVTHRNSVGAGVIRLSALADGYEVKALQQLLLGLPRVLVLGAGPDAVPVVQGFLGLGWRVTVGDHREAALLRTEFGEARRLFVKEDAILQSFLRDEQPAAIVIMSHNLQADARYLRLAAHCDCTYLGVLGPAQRRAKLLEGLEPKIRERLESRVVGPIGLAIGADSPASIAISIVAQVFAEIKAGSLSAGSLPYPQEEGAGPARSPSGSTDRTRVT